MYLFAKGNGRTKMRRIVLTIMLFGVISASNATMVADGVELVSNQSWITGNVIDAHMEDNNTTASRASVTDVEHTNACIAK